MTTIIQNLPAIIAAGIELLAALLVGIVQAIPQILAFVPDLFDQLVTAFTDIDWASLGKQLIDGIISGVTSAASALWEAVKGVVRRALGAAQDEAQVGSPSKLFANDVGRWIPAGVAMGVDENLLPLENSMRNMIDLAAGDPVFASSAPIGRQTSVADQTFGSGGAQGGTRVAIFNINGREFMRAVFEDQQAVANEHGVSLIMA